MAYSVLKRLPILFRQTGKGPQPAGGSIGCGLFAEPETIQSKTTLTLCKRPRDKDCATDGVLIS